MTVVNLYGSVAHLARVLLGCHHYIALPFSGSAFSDGNPVAFSDSGSPFLVGADVELKFAAGLLYFQILLIFCHGKECDTLLIDGYAFTKPEIAADFYDVRTVVQLCIVVVLDSDRGFVTLSVADRLGIGALTGLSFDNTPVRMCAGDCPGVGRGNDNSEGLGRNSVQIVAVVHAIAQFDSLDLLFVVLIPAAPQPRNQGCSCKNYVN